MVCLKRPDDFYFIGDFIEISYAIKTTGLAGGLY